MEMVAKKAKKGEEHTSQELIENPDAIAEQFSRTEAYINKNKNTILIVGGVIALLIAGYFGYRYYKNTENLKGQSEMFQAIYYFENDSLDLALNGDGQYLGLTDIADEYSGTDAGNLANYYAGVSYLKQGKFELAILYLEDFSSDDLLVQARAYSLIGDAYMEQGDYEKAAEYYGEAASYKPNEFFTPQYLLKEALAHEKTGNNDEAIATYDEIIKNYSGSSEYSTALKYKARLDVAAK